MGNYHFFLFCIYVTYNMYSYYVKYVDVPAKHQISTFVELVHTVYKHIPYTSYPLSIR